MIKKDETQEKHHTGSVAAEDDELTLWLNKLWARSEPPERLELWQMFGLRHRGELIHHEDFRLGDKLDPEQANKLANEVLASAQNDCDAARKESSYQIAIIDRNRKASPLIRRIGPLQPKRTYALTKAGTFEEEGTDEELNPKSITLKQIIMMNQENRADKQRNDHILSELLFLYDSTVRNQQIVIDKQFAQRVGDFEARQNSEDRSLDRELIRKREDFTRSLWRDGLRTAQNLLPGFFSTEAASGALAATSVTATPASNGSINGATKKNYGFSPERALVENLLHYCEEDKINIVLFGDYEDRSDGKIVLTKPGIFSFEQYRILIGVREGHLPAAALDNLMPDSGHKVSITEAQLQKAREAGVTEGIGVALIELIGLRDRAKETANRSTAHETPPEETTCP